MKAWIERNWWAWKTAALVIGAAVWIIGGVVVVWGVTQINLETQRVGQERADYAKENQVILTEILELSETADEFVGPEAEARQAAAIQGLVDELDCDRAEQLQQVVDGLVETGAIRPGAVVVNC